MARAPRTTPESALLATTSTERRPAVPAGWCADTSVSPAAAHQRAVVVGADMAVGGEAAATRRPPGASQPASVPRRRRARCRRRQVRPSRCRPSTTQSAGPFTWATSTRAGPPRASVTRACGRRACLGEHRGVQVETGDAVADARASSIPTRPVPHPASTQPRSRLDARPSTKSASPCRSLPLRASSANRRGVVGPASLRSPRSSGVCGRRTAAATGPSPGASACSPPIVGAGCDRRGMDSVLAGAPEPPRRCRRRCLAAATWLCAPRPHARHAASSPSATCWPTGWPSSAPRPSDDAELALALAPLTASLARVERHVGELERERSCSGGGSTRSCWPCRGRREALRQQTGALAGALRSSERARRLGRGAAAAGGRARGHARAGRLRHAGHGPHRRRRDRPARCRRAAARRQVRRDRRQGTARCVPRGARSGATGEAAGVAARRREVAATDHARALRAHVESLAAKRYWTAFTPTPELVVCFVPGESFLAAACEADPGAARARDGPPGGAGHADDAARRCCAPSP